jgi:uncharacterized protein (UPF0264 family)
MDRNARLDSTDPLPSPDSPDRQGDVPNRGLEWLVSVRSVAEAELAAQFPVDILDLKEPRGGSLAAVTGDLWRAISGRPGAPTPVSVALGESGRAVAIAGDVPETVRFAKAGPSGVATAAELRALWRGLRDKLPDPVELVAVAYADHDRAGCLPPEVVFALAADFGLRRVLLDTFDKRFGSAVRLVGPSQLQRLGRMARRRSLWWSLAGGITLDDVRSLLRDASIRPDCVAVRGDVCAGDHSGRRDRTGELCRQRMSQWSGVLERAAKQPNPEPVRPSPGRSASATVLQSFQSAPPRAPTRSSSSIRFPQTD